MSTLMDMTPTEIKKALKAVNVKQVDIARDLGLTKYPVSHAISGFSKSKHIRLAIAKAINKPVEEVFEP